MARQTGMSQTAVCRIWQAFRPQTSPDRASKLSPTPSSSIKVRASWALPQPARRGPRALRGRGSPSPGSGSHRSHPAPSSRRPGPPDPRLPPRFGVTNLYAALNLASRQVIANLTPRHGPRSSSSSFASSTGRCRKSWRVHVVVDNSSTHKTPAVKRWLLAHPRFVFHHSTYSSWMNLVERWFGELTASGSGEAPTVRSELIRIHPHRSSRLLERASPALPCLAQDRRSDPGQVG